MARLPSTANSEPDDMVDAHVQEEADVEDKFIDAVVP
jgi:hypothetical protein